MKKVKIIKVCPSCNSLLIRIKDQLFCQDEQCSAKQNKKVLHFIKIMKIKGLGEKTVEKLEIKTLHDIYDIPNEVIIDVMGEKLGNKLIFEIDFSKKVTLEKLLPAFSISLIGSTAARKLYTTIDKIEDITFDICKEVGLGDKASTSLLEWITDTYPDFKQLPLALVARANSPVTKSVNIKVCITGKLDDYSSRGLATSFLISKGITVVTGISKSLDYLINEDNKPSSKLSKASSYNIPIITINHLIEEIIK